MRITRILFVGTLMFLGSLCVFAQKPLTSQVATPAKLGTESEVRTAGFLYKGLGIGMSADDVRKTLGDPRDKSDPQDLFVFSDDESAQFIYGPDKKVTAVMITYSGKLAGAPTAKDVFGEEVPAKADGGVSKMVRYQKAGYWISYNKIVGGESMISIAMQKM